MSQSSKPCLDPLSDVLDVLGARVTRRTRMEAAGRWALAFSSIDRLKFVALLQGEMWMLVPGHPPQPMRTGDVCLLGPVEYVVASDPSETPIDGHSLYDGSGNDAVTLGGNDTIALGGSVTFQGAGAEFLLDMLPGFMFVPQGASESGSIATILALISSEIEREAMGGGIVSARLADVLMIEAMRAFSACAKPTELGWLGALRDRRIGRALAALHEDVAHAWSVAELAGVAGMSRAAFSAEFARCTGKPPLTYLRSWRLAIARAALAGGETTVSDVACRVGYTSQSAFSQAFRRAFGSSPRADRTA